MCLRVTKYLLLLGACIASHAATLSYDLSIDTSGFAATASEYQFDFILSGTAGNTVTVSNPNFGVGGSLVAGTSPITLTSNTTTFGGSATWQFIPGDVASFTVSSTDLPPIGAFSPDVLEIALEDPSGNAYGTDDPSGNETLFTLNLTGGADTPDLYTGTEAPINGLTFSVNGSTGSSGSTGSTGSTGATPEPATANLVTLVGVGLLGATLLFRKRSET